jgi:hypothetical protein
MIWEVSTENGEESFYGWAIVKESKLTITGVTVLSAEIYTPKPT